MSIQTDQITELWGERERLASARNRATNLRQLAIAFQIQMAMNALTEAIAELSLRELAAHGPAQPVPLP